MNDRRIMMKLKAARSRWPVLHEESESELAEFVTKLQNRYQYLVKESNLVFFSIEFSDIPLLPASPLKLPVIYRHPCPASASHIDDALRAWTQAADHASLLDAIHDKFLTPHQISDNPWLLPYFIQCAFPTFFNHFSTDQCSASAANFIRAVSSRPDSPLDGLKLMAVLLLSSVAFVGDFFASFLSLTMKKTPHNLINSLKKALGRSVRSLDLPTQDLLRFLRRKYENEFWKLSSAVVRSVVVPSVRLWRFAPELVGSFRWIIFHFEDDPPVQMSRFPLVDQLLQLSGDALNDFCGAFWRNLQKAQFWAAPISMREMVGREEDLCYMSDLDLCILDKICGLNLPQQICLDLSAAFRVFRQALTGAQDETKPRVLRDERERLRCEFHENYRMLGVDFFRDTPDLIDVCQSELNWFNQAIDNLHQRVKSFRQLEADLETLRRFRNCVFMAYADRFQQPANCDSSVRHRRVGKVVAKQFCQDLRLVIQSDVKSTFPESWQLFDNCPDSCRMIFSEELVNRVIDKWRAAVGDVVIEDLSTRYQQLRESYQAFLAMHFLHHISMRKVELEGFEKIRLDTKLTYESRVDRKLKVPVFLLTDCVLRMKLMKDDKKRFRGFYLLALSCCAAHFIDAIQCECAAKGTVRKEEETRLVLALRGHFSLKQWQTCINMFASASFLVDKAKQFFALQLNETIEDPIREMCKLLEDSLTDES
jgi:hypothetical protein